MLLVMPAFISDMQVSMRAFRRECRIRASTVEVVQRGKIVDGLGNGDAL